MKGASIECSYSHPCTLGTTLRYVIRVVLFSHETAYCLVVSFICPETLAYRCTTPIKKITETTKSLKDALKSVLQFVQSIVHVPIHRSVSFCLFTENVRYPYSSMYICCTA